MSRITNQIMATWKPKPAPRETVAELKATAAHNALRLKQMEDALKRARDRKRQPPPEPVSPPEPSHPREDTNNIRFEEIYKAVRDDFQIDRETLEGKGRHPRTLAARRALVWLVRKRTLLSFPEICKSLGRNKQGHSTMIDQFYAAEVLKDRPMHPQTSETFGEYFVRFEARMDKAAQLTDQARAAIEGR